MSRASAVVWSIAGIDSSGGAGLAADQRAADAAGVSLCTVVAALTAQHRRAVEGVMPVPATQLAAQLAAVERDGRPAVVKTGLLGSVENVRVVAEHLDRMRRQGPVALVVDPVLRASTGASFADAPLLQAYRDELLPRATLVTPNRAEAAQLAGEGGIASTGPGVPASQVPALARALVARGARAACVTGGDADEPDVRDRHEGPGGGGWVVGRRRLGVDDHGTGCAFATGAAAALARGFDLDEAAILAHMLVASGLHPGAHRDGAGAGPVRPEAGFAAQPSLFPTWQDDRDGEGPAMPSGVTAPSPAPGLRIAPVRGPYAIAPTGARAAALFEVGFRTVQLRLKREAEEPEAAWSARLAHELELARRAARRGGGALFVNDHWQAAIAAGVDGLHLGQEDLDGLDAAARRAIAAARARGLALGLSSHTVRELARARAWAPDYIACGPVWSTTTKTMPWRPQGLDNLRWWVRMAGAPVVAIGGLTTPTRLAAVAREGAAAGALVRAVANATAVDLAAWRLAWEGASTGGGGTGGTGSLPIDGVSSGAGAEADRDADAWPHPARGPAGTA
jgi:hydroxymethylpyrimidine kinase/phosphomethylpyrimidine kinase/thiamine-phosphate diphosphorylase